MHTTVKLILCACLLVAAVTLAAITIADLTRPHAGFSGALMLGSYNGSVAVYDTADRTTPLQVTNIEMASLRDSDRALLEHGFPVAGREELLSLLEDLGS